MNRHDSLRVVRETDALASRAFEVGDRVVGRAAIQHAAEILALVRLAEQIERFGQKPTDLDLSPKD